MKTLADNIFAWIETEKHDPDDVVKVIANWPAKKVKMIIFGSNNFHEAIRRLVKAV